MKAMVLVPGADGGVLVLTDRPEPQLRTGELLVAVKALALNRADIYEKRRLRGEGGGEIIGREFAGEVVAVSPNVSGFRPGDRVLGMGRQSAAELMAIDARLAFPVPERLSWEEAASIPVVFFTAHDAMVTNAKLQPGESVLVQAASSGVGVAALQLARLLGARPVIGTSSSDAKLAMLTNLGMEVGIDTSRENFADRVLAVTDDKGVDVVVDNVGGGSYLPGHLRCMALNGRLVSVGRLATNKGELDLDLLALKRLKLIGVTFRTRTREEHVAVAQAAARDLLPGFADGRLRAVVDRAFPLAEAAAAQAHMEANAHTGKIVITVP